MQHFISPWLYKLERNRKQNSLLVNNESHDIVIVGGGIAGIVTAYYLLKNTNHKVSLLEANLVASGATGHNAGQLVEYFEKPFSEIVEEYGLEMALDGQKSIHSAWKLLESISKEIKLKTPLKIFEGFSGCTSFEPIYTHLLNRHLRTRANKDKEVCFISNTANFIDQIPHEFKHLYSLVPAELIPNILETHNSDYVAAFTSKKGCLNSAAFCEELATYLLHKFGDRFSIYENSPVKSLELFENYADISTSSGILKCNKVILCTNGFRHIKIINHHGAPIEAKFGESLRGVVGYMQAYTLDDKKSYTAISYYNQNDNQYFYMTRRKFEITNESLICIGGPEKSLHNKRHYKINRKYPKFVTEAIDNFLKETRFYEFKNQHTHEFLWHGLMGYTKNGIRIIGPDRNNPILLYNLGCNGVGILPSIYGGKKISAYIQNNVRKKSIFDPFF
jgi:glycine/D-amino acid oxidase-like deaminating enzyme